MKWVPVQEENEGPVTKSIRLTACLILRNLARYSQEGRRFAPLPPLSQSHHPSFPFSRKLRQHEGSLALLALSRLESGACLAQLLAELDAPRQPRALLAAPEPPALPLPS